MNMALGEVNIIVRDYDKETSGISVRTPEIDSVNIDDYITPATGYIDVLVAAINAVVIGTLERSMLTVDKRVIATALPTDKNAQRETKALVGIHDSVTGERYVFTIPAVDLTLLPATRSGEFDLTTGAWATLKAALEASYVTKDGNLMVVDYAKHVGRNI